MFTKRLILMPFVIYSLHLYLILWIIYFLRGSTLGLIYGLYIMFLLECQYYTRRILTLYVFLQTLLTYVLHYVHKIACTHVNSFCVCTEFQMKVKNFMVKSNSLQRSVLCYVKWSIKAIRYRCSGRLILSIISESCNHLYCIKAFP